jgi:hypothetical protein
LSALRSVILPARYTFPGRRGYGGGMRCRAEVLVAAMVLSRAASAGTCEAIKEQRLPQTTIVGAEVVAAGAYAPPGGRAKPELPAFCRVTGTIQASKDSDIRFEVWMPATGWNGRFRGIGNGGFAGSISYRPLELAVSRGYAAAATDTGHQAGGPIDARWALGHPEKVIDFGYRAIHEMTERAKAIVAAFYGKAPDHSYFASCSNGGRQALMEAQRYPADYDGIVAGAPANAFTHLLAQGAWDVKNLRAGYLPSAKLPGIEAATLAACDALDGVKDGVLDDPRRCRFDPATLACKGADAPDCLTAPQLSTLQSLYAGARTRAGQLHPGHVPGGMAAPDGWPLWITGPAPGESLVAGFASNFFRYMVFEKPDWDPTAFDLERDSRLADRKLARILDATDPDLRRFQQRGGKLILFHGWSDPAISALNTIAYYDSVVAKVGARAAKGFVRLFMAPGMLHCDGGTGPGSFFGMDALAPDAGHDVAYAAERWVEEDIAPAQIIAARYRTDKEPKSGVLRTRPLCPYPQVARWKGTGSTDDAASFSCAAP